MTFPTRPAGTPQSATSSSSETNPRLRSPRFPLTPCQGDHGISKPQRCLCNLHPRPPTVHCCAADLTIYRLSYAPAPTISLILQYAHGGIPTPSGLRSARGESPASNRDVAHLANKSCKGSRLAHPKPSIHAHRRKLSVPLSTLPTAYFQSTDISHLTSRHPRHCLTLRTARLKKQSATPAS